METTAGAASASTSTAVTLVEPISLGIPTALPGMIRDDATAKPPDALPGGTAGGADAPAATAALPRNSKGKDGSEGKAGRRRGNGCFWRYWSKIEQQEIPGSSLPLRAFGRPMQCGTAGCCTVLFAALSGILLSIAGSFEEIVVPYSYKDNSKVFTVEKDLKGPVLVWYEIPDLSLNHKSAVAGKDSALWGGFISNYQCDGASSLKDALWRRPSSPLFQAMLSSGGVDAFRPCGLVVMASFTDTFAAYSSKGTKVVFDSSDLSMDKDKDMYKKKIEIVSGGAAPVYTIKGSQSWLKSQEALERFEVWYRTPASSVVRHIYARINDGLPAGQYSLNFSVNDPVYEKRWSVSEKRIVISESKTLGSVGACTALGIFCILIASFEAIMTVIFLASPMLGAASNGSLTKTVPTTHLLTTSAVDES